MSAGRVDGCSHLERGSHHIRLKHSGTVPGIAHQGRWRYKDPLGCGKGIMGDFQIVLDPPWVLYTTPYILSTYKSFFLKKKRKASVAALCRQGIIKLRFDGRLICRVFCILWNLPGTFQNYHLQVLKTGDLFLFLFLYLFFPWSTHSVYVILPYSNWTKSHSLPPFQFFSSTVGDLSIISGQCKE